MSTMSYTVPMPQWLLCAIDSDVIDGKVGPQARGLGEPTEDLG
jgi:hypothetical protein